MFKSCIGVLISGSRSLFSVSITSRYLRSITFCWKGKIGQNIIISVGFGRLSFVIYIIDVLEVFLKWTKVFSVYFSTVWRWKSGPFSFWFRCETLIYSFKNRLTWYPIRLIRARLARSSFSRNFPDIIILGHIMKSRENAVCLHAWLNVDFALTFRYFKYKLTKMMNIDTLIFDYIALFFGFAMYLTASMNAFRRLSAVEGADGFYFRKKSYRKTIILFGSFGWKYSM